VFTIVWLFAFAAVITAVYVGLRQSTAGE
jgi:hypothetical protein